MTEKQKIFADEYIIDLNATRAYKEAYPTVKKDEVAKAKASKLLTKADIEKYVNEKLKESSGTRIADTAEVMQYLTSVLRGEETEEVIAVEGCGGGCSSAVKVNKGFGAKDRIKAAELLGKRFGMFTEKVQIEESAVVQIIDNVPKGDGYD
ncbi:MAG TPA: terminase small subunit [Lachnospiraceae bacterium]|nr:terminase small subunit [Lachnospiraceae bacterium]